MFWKLSYENEIAIFKPDFEWDLGACWHKENVDIEAICF